MLRLANKQSLITKLGVVVYSAYSKIPFLLISSGSPVIFPHQEVGFVDMGTPETS